MGDLINDFGAYTVVARAARRLSPGLQSLSASVEEVDRGKQQCSASRRAGEDMRVRYPLVHVLMLADYRSVSYLHITVSIGVFYTGDQVFYI